MDRWFDGCLTSIGAAIVVVVVPVPVPTTNRALSQRQRTLRYNNNNNEQMQTHRMIFFWHFTHTHTADKFKMAFHIAAAIHSINIIIVLRSGHIFTINESRHFMCVRDECRYI